MADYLDAEVGLGPHPLPWPQGDHYDPELLRDGDRRNVLDPYRYWRREAIVADLDSRRHPFHVAIENWQHDLNIGTVVRNANASWHQPSILLVSENGTVEERWSLIDINT